MSRPLYPNDRPSAWLCQCAGEVSSRGIFIAESCLGSPIALHTSPNVRDTGFNPTEAFGASAPENVPTADARGVVGPFNAHKPTIRVAV
jgi:hypothetical protein